MLFNAKKKNEYKTRFRNGQFCFRFTRFILFSNSICTY